MILSGPVLWPCKDKPHVKKEPCLGSIQRPPGSLGLAGPELLRAPYLGLQARGGCSRNECDAIATLGNMGT